MKRVVAMLALCGSGAMAQDLAFDPGPTVACLAQADIGSNAAFDCIGRAADACMATPDGGTTVGMGYCLGAEWEWWDARLNGAYAALMERHKATDAEMAGLGATVPSLSETFKAMQRAWIPFRDAACDYERANWGGGTGGGPATAACLMVQTGRQALSLESRLEQ